MERFFFFFEYMYFNVSLQNRSTRDGNKTHFSHICGRIAKILFNNWILFSSQRKHSICWHMFKILSTGDLLVSNYYQTFFFCQPDVCVVRLFVAALWHFSLYYIYLYLFSHRMRTKYYKILYKILEATLLLSAYTQSGNTTAAWRTNFFFLFVIILFRLLSKAIKGERALERHLEYHVHERGRYFFPVQ